MAAAGAAAVAAQTIDLAKPITLTAFSEPDKKAGFYQLDGDKLTKLVYEDRSLRPSDQGEERRPRAHHARDVRRIPRLLGDGQPSSRIRSGSRTPIRSRREFKWGHRILFDYKDKDGHKLQGTLAIPDDYQPGQKLPMLVDYYEKNSQNLNQYEVPRYATAPQYVDYVSNGYLVMVPDIYYHTGPVAHRHAQLGRGRGEESRGARLRRSEARRAARPQLSAARARRTSRRSRRCSRRWSPARRRSISSPTSTSSGRRRGTNQHRYDTYGQGRFGTNPYDNLELFQDQSAVFHAKTMNTPLLILQGTNDGSTEWLQGVEFYNALRFLKKPVIFLSYEGEAHGFTRYDNQYDVEVRMHQFYDHYLKGVPAADWIANGVPFLKKKTPTGAAAQPVTLMGGGAGIGTPMTGRWRCAAGGARRASADSRAISNLESKTGGALDAAPVFSFHIRDVRLRPGIPFPL